MLEGQSPYILSRTRQSGVCSVTGNMHGNLKKDPTHNIVLIALWSTGIDEIRAVFDLDTPEKPLILANGFRQTSIIGLEARHYIDSRS